MPTIDWNRVWAKNLVHHLREGADGSHYGDQWGDPEVRDDLRAVRDRFVLPLVDPSKRALEIGSGGGRWTQYLLPCREVICVELNPEMFSYLIDRFGAPDHLNYVTSHGSDLPFVPERHVDFAFSFGVFVHLDLPVIEGYLRSLRPVLREGGHLVVQFSDKRKPGAASNPDFSDNDPERMRQLLTEHGFAIEEMDEEVMDHSAIVRARKV